MRSQIDALKDYGCEKIFQDIGSGVKEDRVELTRMIESLRKGDTVVVYKIDRIFRSLKNLVNLIDTFNDLGVHFKSLQDPAFDTTTTNGKFLLQIFGAVAEFERNLIAERTKSGLAAARARKIHLGRPTGSKDSTLAKYEFANHLYRNKNVPISEACKQAQISKATFYRVEKTKH